MHRYLTSDPLVLMEYRFVVGFEELELVDFDQMVVLGGIDCSFDLGIEMAAVEEFGCLGGDLIVDEFLRLFVGGRQPESLVAFLVVVSLFVVEQPLQRPRRIHGHQLLHLHQDW